MLILNRKKMGIRISEVWLPDETWEWVKSADIIDIHGLRCKDTEVPAGFCKQNTLISDLTIADESLFDGIQSKTYKYDIKRSLNDNINIIYYNSSEIKKDENILDSFFDCYEKMYLSKGMCNKPNKAFLHRYVNMDAVYLSLALFEGEFIVYHVYLDCGEVVRLLYSCSDFRNDKEHATIIARANKRLHYEDWIHFKNMGKKRYDWGGVFDFSGENGIDKFKMSFGGEQHYYYNGIVTSKKGKLVLFLNRLLRR